MGKFIVDSRSLPWIIVAVLVGMLVWSLRTDSGEPSTVEKHTTDTLVVYKTDTVVLTKVKTVEKPVPDTTYIVHNDTVYVPVPRMEYTFSEKDVFDMKVKGFDVEFIEANVYPKTVYKTITNEKTVETTKYRSSLFVFGGLDYICGEFSPNAGIAMSMKGKWLIGAKIGIYGQSPIYGAHIGYNILQKR